MICRILFLLFVSSSAAFDVNVTQIKYHEKENHNVTLEWTFTTNSSSSQNKTFVSCDLITDDKSYNFYQLINGKEVLDSQHKRFSGRVQSESDLSSGRIRLHVSRLRTEDSGLYVCDVTTDSGHASAVTHLKVISIPLLVVNVTQRNYQAEENHNVTLEWTFTTNNKTKPEEINILCEQLTKEKSSVLYLVHAGVEIPEPVDKRFSGRVQSDRDDLSSGRIRLHVSRLRTNDSGLYRCEVETNLGHGSASTQLNVTQALQLLVVNVTQRNYQAEENHNITLEWTFNNTKTKVEEINIVCEQLTKEKSSVLYVVHAGVEIPASVDKRFSGRVQSESDLSSGQIRLHVSRLRTEDSGRYECEVTTGSGIGSNYCELNVTAEAQRPTERPTPSPQPEIQGRTRLITGLIVGVLVCVCVIWIIVEKRRPSNSQGVRNSRTPLCDSETSSPTYSAEQHQREYCRFSKACEHVNLQRDTDRFM